MSDNLVNMPRNMSQVGEWFCPVTSVSFVLQVQVSHLCSKSQPGDPRGPEGLHPSTLQLFPRMIINLFAAIPTVFFVGGCAALRDKSGTFIVNGQFTRSKNGVYTVAGNDFRYRHLPDGKETLESDGPLTRDAEILVGNIEED